MDKGGNTLEGTFEGEHFNLHQVWDEAIIGAQLKKTFNSTEDAYGDALVHRIVNGDFAVNATRWAACSDKFTSVNCPNLWAQESAALSCSYAYMEANGQTKIRNDFALSGDYYDRNGPLIEEQLAKGGVRLAAMLTAIYGQ